LSSLPKRVNGFLEEPLHLGGVCYIRLSRRSPVDPSLNQEYDPAQNQAE